jgi:ABC-type enterochelin transport system ATPase subunit
MSVNIASRSNEIEIQLLRKKVVELEELTSRLQTDDTKNSALVEVKKELEAIVKKYDMVKRLCNLRNEDNNQLKLKVDDMTKFINESQLKHEKECEALRQKYIMARELGDFRRKKIDELENALKNQL